MNFIKHDFRRFLCAVALMLTFGIGAGAGVRCNGSAININAPQSSLHGQKVEFIKVLYKDYVFGGGNLSLIADRYITPKLRKKLRDAYEYDCPDGEECYAVWMFRSGAQDGPGDVSKLKSIIRLNNGWYRARFIDMGIEGSVLIKFVDVEGSFMMDEIKNETKF